MGPTGSGKSTFVFEAGFHVGIDHTLNGPRLVLDGLGFNPPVIALGVPMLPEKPAPNLNIMQHYILPAKSPILRLLAKITMKDGNIERPFYSHTQLSDLVNRDKAGGRQR
ncbi:hypothetical protein GALMADRAFT_221976 [Galerina marginata CBS 339.88]|uniref:Uncharacterized protein n=1 Tax=Galerina marginata (strain CBS 339.88) TaxID=685588 RepID=A0A067TQA2_GALM3|nr:hypothetical protein GALMADRAFT_221976 [Galerina marginata CBS 339.88]